MENNKKLFVFNSLKAGENLIVVCAYANVGKSKLFPMETFYTTTGLKSNAGEVLWGCEPHGRVEKYVRKLKEKVYSTDNHWVLDLIRKQYQDVESKRVSDTNQSLYANIAVTMIRQRKDECNGATKL
tara:strand:- start:193 stop:573 length:381 start_codon:yes stop_codon:yes gene_type:complete